MLSQLQSKGLELTENSVDVRVIDDSSQSFSYSSSSDILTLPTECIPQAIAEVVESILVATKEIT